MPRVRPAGVVIWLGLALLAAPTGPALGAPGDLDPSFDGDGKRTIDYGGVDEANALALRPDGRIVVVGNGNPARDVAIQSLLPDGSGDASFDLEGSLGIGLAGDDYGQAVALQPSDGRIVVAGSTQASAGNDDLAVLRVNLDGSPDTAFNGTGQQIIDYGGKDFARALALEPDGGIVVVGNGSANSDVSFQRLLANGALAGSVGIDLGGGDLGAAMALQPDGKILVAGETSAGAGGTNDFAILRVNSDFSLDMTFAGDGKRILDYDGYDRASALALQPDGRVVVAGVANPQNDLTIQRLLPNGSSDLSFGGGGSVGFDLGGLDVANALALQPDGKILVGGFTAAGGVRDFAILRIQPGGALDTTFAGDGKRLIDFGGTGADGATSLALQPDGRIVAAGYASQDVGIVRLLGDSGSLGGGGSGGPGAGSGVPRCAGRAATVVGTNAHDRLLGTGLADVIASLGGKDVIKSGRGNDLVCAGSGNDTVLGNPGKDRLFGQNGKDRLLGGAGTDRLNGGAGKDRLAGGAGRDRCLGGPGRDRASCERERGI